ncbi:MAG: MFS transporter [Chloroflexi bacterium]|nr:MFS transporter [Chloroflexota bacterium]
MAWRRRVYQFRARRERWLRRARYLRSRLPWRQSRETIHEQNIWNLYMDVAWWGIANGVWLTYLSVFAVRLGASTQWLGVLAALPALVNMIWAIPSARIVERAPRRLPLVLRVGFLQRLAWLGVALVPFLFTEQAGVFAIVFIAGLTTIPAATSTIAFTNVMADLIPPQDRARVVSIRSVLLSATTTLTVLGCGPILDALPFPVSYQVVFGFSFLAAMMSLRYVARLHVPEEVSVAHRERPKAWSTTSIRNAIREVTAAKPFVNYVVSSLIFHWGIYFPTALYSIYRVRNLGATDTWIGLLTMVDSVLTIVFYIVWGRLATQWGNRRVLIIGAFGMIAFPALTGLATSLPMLLLPAIIAGIFTPAFNLASFNELLAVSPEAHRPRFIAIYTSAVNAAAFVAPLAGSYMAAATDIRLALYLGGAFRFLGGLAFVLMLGTGMRHGKISR